MNPLEVLELRFCTVVPLDPTSSADACRFKILTPTNSNHIFLEADAEEDAELWMEEIKNACKSAMENPTQSLLDATEEDTFPLKQEEPDSRAEGRARRPSCGSFGMALESREASHRRTVTPPTHTQTKY